MEPVQHTTYPQITEGTSREREYVISPEVYESFLRAFDDRSPIHVDTAYARSAGFIDRVMHGAILNGFLSHFVGMVFPGASSLLLSVELRYQQPSYLEDRLLLRAKVAQKLDAQQVIVLHVTFLNQTRSVTAATGRVQVKVRET